MPDPLLCPGCLQPVRIHAAVPRRSLTTTSYRPLAGYAREGEPRCEVCGGAIPPAPTEAD